MPRFDIAYSLNGTIVIDANDDIEASEVLQEYFQAGKLQPEICEEFDMIQIEDDE